MRFSTSVITKEPLLPGLSAMQYERTPSMGGKFGGGAACRGFAPAPPRFNALMPLPIGRTLNLGESGPESRITFPQGRYSACRVAMPSISG